MNGRSDQKWECVIFVYKADSDIFSMVSDFAHKIISPETYPCRLCALTYGNFAIKKEWKDFLGALKVEKKFLHKNDFYVKYPEHSQTALPAVLGVKDGKMFVVISALELDGLVDLAVLKDRLRHRLGL